jgi:hypothetical protein
MEKLFYGHFNEDTVRGAYKPFVMKKYNILTDKQQHDMILDIQSNGMEDVFRATQYDGYIADGMRPNFLRGTGMANSDFKSFDQNQCHRMLLRLDQKVKILPRVIPDVVPPIPRNNIRDGDIIPKKFFFDKNWCESWDYHEFDRMYTEAYTMLEGIKDKIKKILVFGSMSGHSIKAAQDLGFKVIAFEESPFLKECADKRGIKPNEYVDTVDQLTYYESSTAVIFLHRFFHRNPTAVTQSLRGENPILVLDEHAVYPDFFKLRPTGHLPDRRAATNMDLYNTRGKITFHENEIIKYTQINPDVMVNYDNFCFVGHEAVTVLHYMLLLDPGRKKNYWACGMNANDIMTFFNLRGRNSGKTLFIAGNLVSHCKELMESGDMIYSLKLQREMSLTYLGQILPLLGSVSVYELESLGFDKALRTIPNALIKDGIVHPTHEVSEVMLDFPYIFRTPYVESFTMGEGVHHAYGNVTSDKISADFYQVTFHCKGSVKMVNKCGHINSPFGHKHYHLFKVVDHVNVPVITWAVNPPKVSLEIMPQFFSITSAKMHLIAHLYATDETAMIMCRGFQNDCRVKCAGEWVFNPIGRGCVSDVDLKKIQATKVKLDEENVAYLTSFQHIFGLRWEVMLDASSRRLIIPDFSVLAPYKDMPQVVYARGGDIFIDFGIMRQSATDNRFLMECSKLWKSDNAKNPNDILVGVGGYLTWAVLYV